MDHLGVEVMSTEEVTAASARLAGEGMSTTDVADTTCCYAVQDKVWVTGPGGEPWEVYTVKADDRPDLEGHLSRDADAMGCSGSCATDAARAGSGTTTARAACC
jgi:hypothetical protein